MTENVNAAEIKHISTDVRDIKTAMVGLTKAMTEMAITNAKQSEQFSGVIGSIGDLRNDLKETKTTVENLKEKVHKNTIYNGIIKVIGATVITALSTSLVMGSIPSTASESSEAP